MYSRNRSTGGAELGLPIAQRIVVRLGGELSVGNDSEAGGAIVSGWLPTAATTDSG